MTAQVRWWSAGLEHVPDTDAWIDRTEHERFASMQYTKRRDEARLARFTAKTTVALALGLSSRPAALRSVTIRNAPDGAPEVWIEGVPGELVVAMTDRADWSVAAVLMGEQRVGCDLELVEPRSAAFIADYFTEQEQSTVADADEPFLAANLIWSAKESALKVLRTGLRRDTRTVDVQLGMATSEAWNPLHVNTMEGQELPGWWIRYGSFVLTVAAAVPISPPESLEEPPPLASARPGHAWLHEPRTT